MSTEREEILSNLFQIKYHIEQYIDASNRQITAVNSLRQVSLIQEKEYDKETFSNRFLKIALFCIFLPIITSLFFELLRGKFFVELPRTLFMLAIFFVVVIYISYQHIKRPKSLLPFVMLLVASLASLQAPLALLLEFNIFRVLLLCLGCYIAHRITERYFPAWIDFLNKGVRKRNQRNKQEYDDSVARNQLLEQEYRKYGDLMNIHGTAVATIGQGWYPKDYFTLHAVTYFIHAFENYKADTVKEMVQLYDTHVDRLQRRKFEMEILRIQEEQLINLERMPGLQQYNNVLLGRQIAMTATAAAETRRLAENVANSSVTVHISQDV